MIKLIVVILIVGVLAAVFYPKFFSAPEVEEKVTHISMAGAAVCKSNRNAIVSACFVYYTAEAAKGRTPQYPKDYKEPDLYRNGKVPECPDGGVYVYNCSSRDGVKVTCSIHKE